MLIPLAFMLVAGFLAILKWHSHYAAKKLLIEKQLQIAREELAALEGKHHAFDDGQNFIHRSQSYTYDFDIFGPDSLFQKINRSITPGGASTLALWFNKPELNPDVLREKQAAVAELAEKSALRMDFRARGLMIKSSFSEYRNLVGWLRERDLFYGKQVFKILIILFSTLNLLSTLLYALGLIPGSLVLAGLFTALVIVGFYQKQINRIHQGISSRVKLLMKYVQLFRMVEQEQFESAHLQALQNTFGKEKQSASYEIRRLSKILSALDTRLNVFAGILLNAYFLWDFIQMSRLEKWRRQNREQLREWFSALSRFDALCSLGTLKFNHPHWIFPELTANDFELKARNIKHPMMAPEVCVGNDIEVPGRPHFKIITGANMAGKSTFLRSVGTNMLLAMMGAPVAADAFRLSPVNLISSIRTKDSLMKNESYFYAEIKRLELIIRRLKKGERLFVFLDEILKGTNSKDKEQGSKALLQQLIELNAVGIIATHDLNLGIISQTFEQHIENLCFEVEIRDGALFFDYKIRPGIAQNMSATYLMREMGITV